MATSVMTMLMLSFLIIFLFFPLISCETQLRNKVKKANLKLSHLESLLEETIGALDAKSLYLNDSKNCVEEMTFEMERLQSELSSLKDVTSHVHQRLHQLEEEGRLLWATSRKSNFEIHLLEAKAQEADDRLESVTSHVETMAAIVTERWIQIQQLEQALHIAQTRASMAKRIAMFRRCSFLKWVKNVFGEKSVIGFYLSQAYHDLDTIFAAAKKYHHELQGFIKHEMERNEYTAPLANKEVVFFMASAAFTFPIIGAWMLLSS